MGYIYGDHYRIKRQRYFCKGGSDVASAIADGRAEIGTTFISEVLPVKGARVVGPRPDELYNANTYTAAVHAGSVRAGVARALLRTLTAPASHARWAAGRPRAGLSGVATILRALGPLPNYDGSEQGDGHGPAQIHRP